MANARRRTQRTNRTATRVAARTDGAAAAAALEAEETHAARVTNWSNEMKYINKDLRELLIISVALFALLFIVGFLL